MKKWLTAAVILLLNQTCSFAQWQWLNPQPSGYINNSIVFTDTQTGYIINTNGDLLSTNNQGTAWQVKQHFDNSVNTMNIANGTGVIAGYNNLFMSFDNGVTWQKKEIGIVANFKIVDIVSRDTIFIAGDNSKIYKTTDRGQTWQTLDCGIAIRSIDFVNSKVGYIGAAMQIRKTTDGGQTWTTCLSSNSIPSGTLAIKFVSVDTGYAYREFSDMLRTTDGGQTWSNFTSGISGYMYSISFPSTLIGFMGGEDGAMYRTQNGGISWEFSGNFGRVYANTIYSMYFINNDIGFAVGHRGRILKTTDRGTTWQAYAPSYIDMTSIAFGSKTTGYATAWNNIYKTTNAGLSWTPLSLTVGTAYADNSRFSHSHFFNADTGFVIANNPARIYKTYDGGKNWKLINFWKYGYEYVRDINFINRNTAYASLSAVGAPGLFKSNDGGDTWNEIGSYQDFRHLNFLDEKTGYAVKYSTIHKTLDSGKTWTEILQNIYGYQINSLYFIDAKTGFYGGDYGLNRTNDSGKTWTSLPIDYSDRKVISIKFYNNKIGYFTSQLGAIYKTVDAGVNWQLEGRSAFYDCPSIIFNSDTTVYVAGMYGSILKAPIVSSIVDSLQVTSLRSCSANFSARISAALSSADSIQFEYGKNNFNSVLAATPDHVNDSIIKVSAAVSNLQADSNYKVRLKYFYRGNYVYSNAVDFKPLTFTLAANVTQQATCTNPTGTITVYSSSQFNDITYSIDGLTYTNTTGVFNNVAPGTYTLTAKNGNCISSSATATVTSNSFTPAPVISGATTLCAGGSVTLSSNAASGNQWYKNGVAISGSNATTLVVNSTGSYTATVSANGCISPPSNAIVITSNSSLPQPGVISGANIVCQNTIQTYSVTAVTGATSYTWTLLSGWSGTSTTNSITTTAGSSGGIISITANNSCGSSSSQTLNVGINPVPTITMQGDTMLISSPASNYQWFYNNNILSGETSNKLRIKNIGFYRVETSPDKICWSASLDFPILILPPRLLPDTLSMEIYPNPAVNFFNVVVRLQQVTTVTAFVTISDVSGNVVLQTNKLIFFGNEIKIPITLNATGTFFVKVNINGGVKTLSVILQ